MSAEGFNIMSEVERLRLKTLSPLPFLANNLDDTTVVLLATSLVDNFLRIVLLAGFRKSVVSKRKVAEVFEGHGPLATFSAKISVSSMLGLAPIKVRHDLSILRKIRNDFAHSHSQLHLRDFSACLSLKVTTKTEIADDCEERRRFKHSCAGIIGQLATSTMLNTAQQRFVAKNAEGVLKEYAEMVKEAGKTVPVAIPHG